ncbi:MAG: HAMP domain-containing histidine kinase [Desulfocapsa sp.]|nr:HAMP domain-containing histidine kinase [Desulfocapsa sp.]
MIINFTLYLLYGLAFFTLGVAILSRDVRFSELGIAKIIWLLALFGITHGFHEWLELLEYLTPSIRTPTFSLFRLIVVNVSFLFLLYFGLFLNIITYYNDQALQTTPGIVKALIGIFALSLICTTTYFDLGSGKDAMTRIFVAFPGGLLSGVGLIMYSRTARTFSSKVAINFIFAGIFMCCYAIASGIIPSNVVVPLVGVKIILFRGVCAFLIMLFTIRALSVFNLEQREIINDKLLRFSQSEKLASMGILAAGIAHEINNPLTNASLNLEMLKDQVEDDEKINQKIDAIDRNLTRASKIAKELLHFSREKVTTLEPTDINQVLRSSYTLLNNQKLSSIISLNLKEIPKIIGISWKLEEVFINLLMNSIDACTAEDSIEIKTYTEENCVKVMITDTGYGIVEEDLFKVFDPFYTTKEIGKGTGLGLAVSYNIIKQHGGEITLASSEHGGTVMTLSFPVMTSDN